jgi:hypothetical protein
MAGCFSKHTRGMTRLTVGAAPEAGLAGRRVLYPAKLEELRSRLASLGPCSHVVEQSAASASGGYQ